MSKFVLKQFNDVVGIIKFYKLIEDKVCHWDVFCKEIQEDSNFNEQLISIKSRMNDISNLRLLPEQKFRDITPDKETVKEYEIKTRDLRVYLIKDNNGNIVLIGGKKNNQQKDIREFRALKKSYLNSQSK